MVHVESVLLDHLCQQRRGRDVLLFADEVRILEVQDLALLDRLK